MARKKVDGNQALEAIHILSSKLTPPRLHAVVTRERLLKALDRSSSARLTAIVAGAGFGKSTLAADYLRRRSQPFLWYQLEDTDRDLSVFIAYLEEAMARSGAGGARMCRSARELLGSHGKDRRPALSLLLSRMEECLPEDAYIVLDDFQEVNDSPEITAALDYILAHLPHNLHILILSSREIGLDLSRLRARRETLELREEDICFTAEETARLFNEVFALRVSAEQAAALTDLAEGWITGLVLFSHAMREGEGPRSIDLADTAGLSNSQVFDYFYRVIYLRMDDRMRYFLLRTSILSRIDAGFCDEFLEAEDSRDLLDHLAASHLFVVRLDEAGNSYRYHHLLRSFLRSILENTLSPHEIKRLHARAAALWGRRGEAEEALRHCIEAGDHAATARLMEEMADNLMKANRITYVLEAISSLPEATIHDHPRLALTQAWCHELLGQYRQAIEKYREAATVFSDLGEAAYSVDCLRNAMKLSVLSGAEPDAGCAVTGFARLLEGVHLEQDSWYESAAMLGAGSAYLGLTEWARYFLAVSLAHVDGIREERARITVLTWSGYVALLLGEYNKAAQLLEGAERLCESAGFFSHLPDICSLRSFTLSALGKYAEARKAAEKGLRVSTDIGGGVALPPGLLQNRLARAICLADTGEEAGALRELEQLCELVEGSEDSWLVINCNLFAGTAYMKAGDIERSLCYFRKTEALCRDSGFVDDQLLSRLSRLALSARESDPDEVKQEALSILDALKGRAAGILRSPSLLLLASILHQLGEGEAALETLNAAIRTDEASGGLGWWNAYSRLILPVMESAFSRGEHLDFLARAFRVIGTPSLPFLRRLRKSDRREVKRKAQELIMELSLFRALPLRIYMLGDFRVIKGDILIEETVWRSRKALTVLKYLAAFHGKGPVQREMIMELLWPGMDPDRASKNLNVALTTLRKALDPDSGWGDCPYLKTSGDTLRLNLGEGGYIDVEAFEAKLKEAAREVAAGDRGSRLKALLEAEGIYGGDFLSEDIYEDWCIPLRNALRSSYLNLLREIADAYLDAGEHTKALTYVEKALCADAGSEDLYRRLMVIRAAMGDRAGVEEAFDRCRAHLEDNLGVSPSSETHELLERLRKPGGSIRPAKRT